MTQILSSFLMRKFLSWRSNSTLKIVVFTLITSNSLIQRIFMFVDLRSQLESWCLLQYPEVVFVTFDLLILEPRSTSTTTRTQYYIKLSCHGLSAPFLTNHGSSNRMERHLTQPTALRPSAGSIFTIF